MKRLTWGAVALALSLSAAVVPADEAADLFNSLDKNGDGKLEKSEVSEDQLRHFERMLRAGDKDKDGILTKEEFGSAAKEDQPAPQSAEEGRGGRPGRPGPSPEEMFRRLDKDGNGKVSRDEVKSSDLPEPVKNGLSRQFDELKKEELSGDDMRQLRERMGRDGGRGMLDRLRQFDKNGDGKLSKEELQEIPAEGRERLTQMMERMGRDEIDLNRMGEMMAQGGPGPGGRPRPPEGEGARSRDGERRPDGEMRDGERRPEGPPRDGERRPEGGRDGQTRPEGGPRDGERRQGMRPALMRALDVDGDGRISKEELQNAAAQFDRLDRNQDGNIDMAEAFGPPPGEGGRGMGAPGDGRVPGGDGGRPRGEGDRPRPDGDRPRGDGERARPDGDRPRPEGDRPRGEGDRPRPDGDRPRGEGDRPRPDGDRPRGEGDRPRPEGDRPRGDGDRPRPDGDRPRGDGNRPAGDGQRPRPDGAGGRGEGRGPFNPQEMFRRMDRDEDGFLSEDEAPPRMKENFKQIDKNGDGKLSPDEVRDAIPRRPAGEAPPRA